MVVPAGNLTPTISLLQDIDLHNLPIPSLTNAVQSLMSPKQRQKKKRGNLPGRCKKRPHPCAAVPRKAMYTWCAKVKNNPNMEDDIADHDNAAGVADAHAYADADTAALTCCLLMSPVLFMCLVGVVLSCP